MPSQNLTGFMHQIARLDGFREGTFYDMASATNSFARQLHDKLQAQTSHGHNVFSNSAVSFFRLQQGHAPTVNIAGGHEIHKDKSASEIPHVGSNTRVKANIDV